MGLEHYLNADFDLGLRSGWRLPDGETNRHRITDLAWHGLFLAETGDSVLLPEPIPPDFVDYLDRLGIEIPAVTIEPDRGAGQRLEPFGWNDRTAELARRYDTPVDHPDLEVVRLVNGRRFSARLEDELFGGGHTVSVLSEESELDDLLTALPASETGWLLKAEHGNAGLGNRRLRAPILDDGELKVVRRFFDGNEAVVLERWRRRLRDLCATFVVGRSGEVLGFDLHEVVNTSDGALIGDLFFSDTRELSEWRPAMTDAAAAVSFRLTEEGYFGPACIDAFLWDDDGRARLRRLVDLNARREISAGASRLWRRIGGDGVGYWRFYSRRKLDLGGSYPEVEGRFGPDAFDPDRRRGVLITAPLWLGPRRRTPAKIAVLLVGDSRSEVLLMDRRLREVLEK
jgi:hypothetical protein